MHLTTGGKLKNFSLMQKQSFKTIILGILALTVIGAGWWSLNSWVKPGTSGSSQTDAGQSKTAAGGLDHSSSVKPSASFGANPAADGSVAPRPSITNTPEAALQASRNPSQWASQPGKVDDKGYKLMGYPNSQPLLNGQYVEAFVDTKATGQKFRLTPNQAGEYQRVYVKAQEEIKVKMQFADHKPGSKIAVAALDGGRLANGQSSDLLTLNDQRSVDFAFRPSLIEGIHRVKVLTQNGEVKTLDFWVGNEHILHARTSS